MSDRRYGRRPRAFHPGVPHFSALRMRATAPAPIPLALDYTDVLPADLGMMLNNEIGDCTAAGAGHLIEVWSRYAGGAEITVPDAAVQRFYTECTGYDGVPGDATDTGAVEQDVLTRWINQGFPLDADGAQRQKLVAFIEIDPRNPDDMRRAIYECGGVYFGITVPVSLEQQALDVWDVVPGDRPSGEAHCIVGAGYDSQTGRTKIISWGRRYDVTDAFLAQWCDEAYALVSPLWVEKTGHTPLGMTLDDLRAQAALLRAA